MYRSAAVIEADLPISETSLESIPDFSISSLKNYKILDNSSIIFHTFDISKRNNIFIDI